MKNAGTVTATSSPKSARRDPRLVDTLNLALADSYALMALTHAAHWNIEGSDFFALHKAFEEQYQNLFGAVDEIAERVRALDAYTPGGLKHLAKLADMEEPSAPMSQKEYVSHLVEAHKKTVEDLTETREISGQLNDLETQDLMIGRIAWHQKTAWMLKSYLK